MPTTDQVRRWFPDIVTNHAQRGQAGFDPVCDTTAATKVTFPREGGGTYKLWVHPKTKEAWEAYAQAMRFHGETVPIAGGTHNCRNIGTTDWPSLHAYCTAIDLPPNGRKSATFQAAVLAIRTNSGAQVFRNLEGIDDRMHDQIDCSPAALATGIDPSTIPGGTVMADHNHIPMPSELPRGWADGTWEEWVKRSGTDSATRGHTFYREDLGWVYSRVVAPLEREVSRLALEVARVKADNADQAARIVTLEGAGGGGGNTVPPHTHTGTVKVS